MTRPLDGITVLDFASLLPGPLATFLLAEAGADVIKVERQGGDDMRQFQPMHGETSTVFTVLHGGKKSVTADLKSPAGRAALTSLIAKADVLVEQFRPGVMERLGLGYEAVSAINPKMIYCSITGYGQSGPRSLEAGHDINYQAVTGLLALPSGKPQTPAALAADIAGGSLPAVINILLGLRQRELTGKGMHIDIAMADIAFTFLWSTLSEGKVTGTYPDRGRGLLTGGSPRYDTYETADGRYLACGALEQKFWESFCRTIGLPEKLWDDAADPHATREAVSRLVASRSAAEWAPLLQAADCCVTVVATVEEALADQHFQARGLNSYQATDSTGATIPAVALPISPQFRASAATPRLVPQPGAHNALLD
ncbi:CaiB/BaiF CoA transferase family protein [Rhodoligotrophos ferricapiens]|uniref:CaiB/BaiF CoA transferase family protein n=1 Tax=Rhodoligotrophos ferricapiens TaxID=3069264 RepID=UPI00315D49B2